MNKERLLNIVEQLYWTILAILMIVSVIVSRVADNAIYLVVGLIIIAAAMSIGMFLFEIVFEYLIQKDSEGEA